MQLPLRFSLRLLLLATGIVACSGWAPSVTVDADGLGSSPIAGIVRQHWMADPEQAIGQRVRVLLYQPVRDNSRQLAQADFETAGMRCQPAPSTVCAYAGFVVRELHGLPAENAARGKARVDISIVADRSVAPPKVTVSVQEHSLP